MKNLDISTAFNKNRRNIGSEYSVKRFFIGNKVYQHDILDSSADNLLVVLNKHDCPLLLSFLLGISKNTWKQREKVIEINFLQFFSNKTESKLSMVTLVFNSTKYPANE